MKCGFCGATFVKVNKLQVYCTPDCRIKAMLARKSEKARQARQGRVCPVCSGAVPASRTASASTCSPHCTSVQSNQKRAARRAARPRCKTCNAELSRAGARYCSYECRYDGTKGDLKEQVRWNTIRRKYGLTREGFELLLREQRGRCGICRTTEPGLKGWSVDHDHVTDVVRGILCTRCNIGLGWFRDDPDLLIQAAAYLRQPTAASDRSRLHDVP